MIIWPDYDVHKVNGRNEHATNYISQAIELFKECKAEGYLERAKGTLAAVNYISTSPANGFEMASQLQSLLQLQHGEPQLL